MANEPIIKLRDFGVSTAIFEWNNDGKTSYSISLQRSYKKKDATEYTNETINLYPEDLLKYARLLEETYQRYINFRLSKPSNSQPAPVASIDDSDSIPF